MTGSQAAAASVLFVMLNGMLAPVASAQTPLRGDRITQVSFLSAVDALVSSARKADEVFLTDNQIAWILEAEGSLRSVGISAPGQTERFHVIAESYYNQAAYGRAVEFFLRARDLCRMEEAAWLWRYAGLAFPFHVAAATVSGAIPACGAVEFRSETLNATYVAFHGGAIYREEPDRHAHAVVFVSPQRDNWPVHLAHDERWLKITLKNGQRYRFDRVSFTLDVLPRP